MTRLCKCGKPSLERDPRCKSCYVKWAKRAADALWDRAVEQYGEKRARKMWARVMARLDDPQNTIH